MTETVELKKTRRKIAFKEEFPPSYHMIEGKGKNKVLTFLNRWRYGIHPDFNIVVRETDRHIIAPSSRLIPLMYLHMFAGTYLMKQYTVATTLSNITLIKDVLGCNLYHKKVSKMDLIMAGVSKTASATNQQASDIFRGDFTQAINPIGYITRSTWLATVMPLTLLSPSADGVTRPRILPVILPENLLYQRLRLTLGLNIDLEYVIVLVDMELDNINQMPAGMYQWYKNSALPVLKDSACQIWKVPQSVIEELCFITNTYNFHETSVKGRKEEGIGRIAEFLSNYDKLTPTIQDVVEIMPDDIDDDEEEEDWDDDREEENDDPDYDWQEVVDPEGNTTYTIGQSTNGFAVEPF